MNQATTFDQLPLVNSVSTRLFRNVFFIYFFVVICLTLVQMVSEYRHVQEEIFRELGAIETTIAPQLASALSAKDGVRLSSAIASLSRLPIVEGITIENKDGTSQGTSTMQLWNWKQARESENGMTGQSVNEYQGDEFFKHTFAIIDPVWRISIGTGIIYVSDHVVWDRVEYGFKLIIVNSILKTLALWGIFLILSRTMLAKPLGEIVSVIRRINMHNLQSLTINLKRKHKDELKIIETVLKEMVQNLATTQEEIRRKSIELEEKNRQLQKVDQLKDEFLANTSHELRTPLHGIIGIARSLKASLHEKRFKDARLNLNLIIASGRHLSLLVDDILDFSKLRYQNLLLKLKSVDVRQVVRIVEQLSRPLIGEKQLELDNRVSPDLCLVLADDARLQQILQNLIGNAIKFSEEGIITIEGRELEGFVEVSVSDQAEPIPDENYEVIFKPFEQGDASVTRQHGGAGLGLAIAKKLVELHGGSISIGRNTKWGNTFSFTLPIAVNKEIEEKVSLEKGVVENPLQYPTIEPQGVDNDRALIRILAVDDDPTNLQVVFNYLTALNYSIKCVQSGQEALDWIEKNGKPDLVLLDIMMPGMNGFEVCKKLRHKYDVGSLPVIFLTASHRRKDVRIGFSIGANDYLTKPFEKSELILRIRLHLRLLLAKRQLQTLRDFANRISDFKNHEQLLIHSVNSMITTRLVTDAVLFNDQKPIWKARKDYEFLNTYPVPDGSEVDVSEDDRKSEILIRNEIRDDIPLFRFYREQCGFEPQAAHFAFVRPRCCQDSLIVLYRSKERMPFNDLDVEFLSNLLDQLTVIEHNVQSMLSDQLVIALPEIQPHLSRITHIQAASPYCSVYLETEQIPREVRISLSSLDFYFKDETLLRIHRSCLINPHKVVGIRKRFVGNKKYRYEVTVGTKNEEFRLRIGDSYVGKLKKVFPRFFN